MLIGEIVKWPTTADCKSAPYGFRGSTPLLTTTKSQDAGVAQLARASAFQAEGRGFESLHPLHYDKNTHKNLNINLQKNILDESLLLEKLAGVAQG